MSGDVRAAANQADDSTTALRPPSHSESLIEWQTFAATGTLRLRPDVDDFARGLPVLRAA